MRDRLCVPLFLAGVVDPEELHMLNGATGMGSPAAGLAATWAAGLAALLVEGLARGLAALGSGLAAGLAEAPAPVASSLPREHRA